MKTTAIIVVFCGLLVACATHTDEISGDGRFCIGEGYEIWSGDEALARSEQCSDPVGTGVFVFELQDGSTHEFRSQEDGRFAFSAVPATEVVSMTFHGGRRAGAFRLEGQLNADSVVHAGENRLFIQLPISACPIKPPEADEGRTTNEAAG